MFSNIPVPEYRVFGVTNDFLMGAAFDQSNDLDSYTPERLSVLQKSTSLVRLKNEAYIATFNQSLLSE